jgi:SAM-dependent methyltransferase
MDWRSYRELRPAKPLRLIDADPRLTDRVATSPYDPHYLHQAVWAGERIFAIDPAEHVDVGSQLLFVAMLATRLPVTFVDLRPLDLEVAYLSSRRGNILDLPFADRSVQSLSCLHVIEHIGLGRYGDTLDPHGSEKAAAELNRILAPGGALLLSLPVGRPRVCFNAHRVHDPREVVAMMMDLELAEFSAVTDDGDFVRAASLDEMARSRYACGLFMFRRGG